MFNQCVKLGMISARPLTGECISVLADKFGREYFFDHEDGAGTRKYSNMMNEVGNPKEMLSKAQRLQKSRDIDNAGRKELKVLKCSNMNPSLLSLDAGRTSTKCPR